MNDIVDKTVDLLKTLGHVVDEEAVVEMKAYVNELLPSPPTPTHPRHKCAEPVLVADYNHEQEELGK